MQPDSQPIGHARRRHSEDAFATFIDDSPTVLMCCTIDFEIGHQNRRRLFRCGPRDHGVLICIAVGVAGSVFVRQSAPIRKEVRKQLSLSQFTDLQTDKVVP